jgi:hypothetical protein
MGTDPEVDPHLLSPTFICISRPTRRHLNGEKQSDIICLIYLPKSQMLSEVSPPKRINHQEYKSYVLSFNAKNGAKPS